MCVKTEEERIDSLFERGPGDLIIVEKLLTISKDPVAIDKRNERFQLLKKQDLCLAMPNNFHRIPCGFLMPLCINKYVLTVTFLRFFAEICTKDFACRI